MDNDIVRYSTDHGEVELTKDTVRKYLVSGEGQVTDQEIVMFISLCKYQQLNPWLREAYLIKYGGAPATMIVGKDTFTKRAANSDTYDGCEAGVITVDDRGEVTNREGTLVLPGETLAGGWARGYRKDWDKPVFGSVNFSEYVGKKKDGSTNKPWAKMPATMIRKVALVQMLRELFPDKFQGLYDSAEMGIDNTDLPEKTIKMPEAKGERDVTPKPGGTENIEQTGSTTGEGKEEKKRRGRPPVKKEGIQKKEEKPEAESEAEIDEAITEKMAVLEKRCKNGIEVMTRKKMIDEIEVEAFTKELKEYMDKGQLEYLQKMYQELYEMYYNKEKEKK